jgi:hypothetical protein
MRTSSVVAFVAVTATAPLAYAHGGHYGGGSTPETDEDLADDQQVITRDHGLVWEGTAGFELGTFRAGGVYDIAFGIAVDGGIRLDRLALLGQYSILWLENPNDFGGGNPAPDAAMQTTPSGLVQRIGAAARYSLVRGFVAHKGSGLRGDIWVEAGAGEQVVHWDGGGGLDRADVDLAVGVQVGVRGKHHHGGELFGVRATFASPPASAPTCAGPCGPIVADHSVLFVFAADFGG